MGPSGTPPRPESPSSDRLDSWKEIAAYLGRDARTAQLWEKREGLPVHRHLHERQGSVYAFKDELNAWRESRTKGPNPPAEITELASPTALPRASPTVLHPGRTALVWSLLLALCAATGVSILLLRPRKPDSVAVLPFRNMSASHDDDWFSDGVTDEIITTLSKVPGLAVTAHTSVERFKNSARDVRELGRELGVEYVLEGSLQRYANRFRINAQLIRVTTGYHVWAESYDRETKDLFDVQMDTAVRIATALRANLSPSDRQAFRRRAPESPEAYEFYLRGMRYLSDVTPQSLNTAAQLFEKALEVDPNFAKAHAGLAEVNFNWFRNIAGDRERLARSEVEARKALGLEPDSPSSHLTLARILGNRNQWDEALQEAKKAASLRPEESLVHEALSWISVHRTPPDPETALREANEAIRLNPVLIRAIYQQGRAYLLLGKYDEAGQSFRHIATIAADSNLPAIGQALVDLAQHRYAEAEQGLDAALRKTPGNPYLWFYRTCVLAAEGKKNEALGAWDTAVRNGFYEWGLARNDPNLVSLRGDPRFERPMR